MKFKVYYDSGEPQKIEATPMNITADIEAGVAVFNDPMMVMFSDDAINTFETTVLSLPFIEGTRSEFEEAYEEFKDD